MWHRNSSRDDYSLWMGERREVSSVLFCGLVYPRFLI